MKIVISALSLLFMALLVTPHASAQTDLLKPYQNDPQSTPKLMIRSPESDSIVTPRFTVNFAVENFTLTTTPERNEKAGVISVYVDGKFLENFATTSAQLNIPRRGTHHIEAELTNVDRTPVVPRVATSMFVSVQSKTPYISVKNIRNEVNVYTDQPKFELDFDPALFNATNSFIKVFVDGQVDGSTEDSTDVKSYTFKNALTPGRHSVRFALFRSNGAAYTPTVESAFIVNYSDKRPDIVSVELPQNIAVGSAAPFKAKVSNFTVGKDGYLMARAGNNTYLFGTDEDQFTPGFQGVQKVFFQLLDRNGFPLNPDVSTEKVVTVSNASDLNKDTAQRLIPPGLFTTAQDGAIPRMNLLVLALIEALAIIAFGIFLVKRQK